VFERLLQVGLIVRPVASYGLADYLRVSIGLPQDNDRLLRELPAAAMSRRNPAATCCARRERVQGELSVPGDKSISHRALMLGGIAEGRTESSGFLASEDCLATLAALRALGVRIERPAKPGCGCTARARGLRAAGARARYGQRRHRHATVHGIARRPAISTARWWAMPR
jgi:hypothetical protein